MGGESCDSEARRGEHVNLVMLFGEDIGDLAGGEACCIREEDLHFVC